MKAFADLYTQIDSTTRTSLKVAVMRTYFASVPPADGAWAVYFLSGRKPKQAVPTRKMQEWTAELAGIPEWLFEECHQMVGDLAETIALLLPTPESATDRPLHEWVERDLLPLRTLPPEEQKERLAHAWQQMNQQQRFVWNKLITGAFRVGVSQQLVVRALSAASGVETAVIAHRLMGTWEPTAEFFQCLVAPEGSDCDHSRPYPFFLAHPLEAEPQTLGDITDWQIEWKWDGIRAQLIRRDGTAFLWSRGEEMILERFPELHPDAAHLPDGTVLDGEVVAWKNGNVLPFARLQRRIGRKTVSKKMLEDVPALFLAFDLLELGGEDVRDRDLAWRREHLEQLFGIWQPLRAQISPLVQAASWDELLAAREQSRDRNVEGLMLKQRSSPYSVGRPRGPWWKWKVDPYTVDAVLIYAQTGHGRRATLFTDYTFAVWDEGKLVPFAKAYSGLTDEEIRQVDRFVRENTLERFGPVRSVKAELVFELAFENIQRSTRHRSGVAVRFPRMARWRHDKRPEDADSLQTIRGMLDAMEARV